MTDPRLPGSLDERDTAGQAENLGGTIVSSREGMSEPSGLGSPLSGEPPVGMGRRGNSRSPDGSLTSPLGPEATDMASDGTSDWPDTGDDASVVSGAAASLPGDDTSTARASRRARGGDTQ